MLTVPEIIDKWPSASALADDLGLKRETHVSVMKVRGSIPATYWQLLVKAAANREIKGITLEVLASAHAKPTPSKLEAGA